MNKILIFSKIDEKSPFAGVGTAGNIWMVMNALLYLTEGEYLYVDMETNKTINNEAKPIRGTMNAWEYYFEQVNKPNLDSELLDSKKMESKIDYNKYYTHLDSTFIQLRKAFWNNFKLQESLKVEIEDYYDANMKNKCTLGVQVRLTDMVHHHNAKKLKDYIKCVKNIIKKTRDIDQIFLATDDDTVIKEFSKQLNIPVIFQKNIYRATEDKRDLNPYDRCEYIRPEHNYLLGKEVILDLFLLSKCEYILKAEISAVSQLAVLFSERCRKTFFVRNEIINRLGSSIKLAKQIMNKGRKWRGFK